MAMSTYDLHDGGYDPVYPQAMDEAFLAEPGSAGSHMATLANWMGAVVSLGLVLGMAVWAVQLTIRDVSGVPVIEALEGPMRTPPADPGGAQAPHQGLAVNRIAEGAEAQPVPDRLVIAPPPVELQDVTLAAAPGDGSGAPQPEMAVVTSDSVASSTPIADETGTDTAALIDRLLQEAQADGPAQAVEAEAVAALSDEPGSGLIPASTPGVAVSLRPAIRPAALRSVQTVARPLDASDPTVELAAAELQDGTRLVQLGAFDTAEIARDEWARLAGQFPDYFVERPRVIEEASSGGQAFYRLRAAGFDDLAGARRFCAVLVAQGAACIPVTVR